MPSLLLQETHVPAKEAAAGDYSDSDMDSEDEACAPWYGVFVGERRLPVPAQEVADYLAAAALQVSLMSML